MKKILILTMAVLLSFPGWAADPALGTDEMVWCGIDYTLVKFIGSSDQFADLPKIQSTYFREWNELIKVESDKYDLNRAFSVATVHYNMENTIIRSQERDMSGIVQLDSYTIDEEQVKSVVAVGWFKMLLRF